MNAIATLTEAFGQQRLAVGGYSTDVAGITANNVVRWDGLLWEPLSTGVSEPTSGRGWAYVSLLAEFGGSSPNGGLFVGVDFYRAGAVDSGSFARWRGEQWHTTRGVEPHHWACNDCSSDVRAMVVGEYAGQPVLYIGGMFGYVNTGPPNWSARTDDIAAWTGTEWLLLGTGIQPGVLAPTVMAMAWHDNSLFVGGYFVMASGVPTRGIARWDGQAAWHDVGRGISFATHGFPRGIHAMGVYDDRKGASLYVGGGITGAGNVQVRALARWDGQEWHDVGGGVNGAIEAMTVFDDGSGTALYVGGLFTEAGGVPANNIAKWDGKQRSALGEGTNGAVRALAVWDRDGEGPEPPGL